MKRYKEGVLPIQNGGQSFDASSISASFVDFCFETTILIADNEMDFRKLVDFMIAVEMLPLCSRPSFF